MNKELFDYLIAQIKGQYELWQYDMNDGNFNDASECKGKIRMCLEILHTFFPNEWESWKKENDFNSLVY